MKDWNECNNDKDKYAVVMLRKCGSGSGVNIVGHVPRRISAACSHFLQRNGTIKAVVSDHRRYSKDLPQGGIEVPCILICKGEIGLLHKVKKLIQHAIQFNQEKPKTLLETKAELNQKKLKVELEDEEDTCVSQAENESSDQWIVIIFKSRR